MKLKPGQKIFLEPTCNAERYTKDIIETEIETVGSKYFTVKEKNLYMTGSKCRFHIDSLKHDAGEYCSNWNAYLSLKEIEDKKEWPILLNKIEIFLRQQSADYLRKILNSFNP